MSRLGRGGESRRADEFARLLDGWPSGAVAIEPGLASMASLAGALRSAGATAPAAADADFRAALRQRLVAVATVQVADPVVSGILTPDRSRPAVSVRVRRGLAVLAATATVATSVAGVAVAASRSLPGDPFYGVKKSTEGLQLWAARGNVAKGKRHLEFARTRLAEAQDLSPTSSHLRSTLSAMNSQTVQGSQELIAAAESSNSTAPLAALTSFTQQQYTGLSSLASSLPPAARAPEVAAVTLLGTVIKQVKIVANGRCVLCSVTNGAPLIPSVLPTPSSHALRPTTSPTASPSTKAQRRHHHQLINGVAPHLSSSASGGATKATHSAGALTSPLPTPTPTKLLPLPTLPLPTLPPNPVTSLLNPPATKKTPKPILSPVPGLSSLLGGLGL